MKSLIGALAIVVVLGSPVFGGVGCGPTLSSPSGIAVEGSGTLVVVDAGLDAVVRIDPVTGDRTIVSDATTGSGDEFSLPRGIAVESDGSLVVVDSGLDAVVRIDPVTGARTIVSDATPGSVPVLQIPRGIAVESAGTLVLVDSDLEAVVRIDPATGARTIVSDATTGSGDEFSSPRGIAVESSGTLVVVDRSSNSAVVRIDPMTGDRTIVSDDTNGSGVGFSNPQGIAVEASGTLVVVDFGLDAVVRIDPQSGDRTIVSDGPGLLRPDSIAVEGNGDLVVVDSDLKAVVRVSPTSGDRTIVSEASIGNGPVFADPVGVAVEGSGDLVVIDSGFDAVLRVNPVSGDRTIVSGIDPDTGTLIGADSPFGESESSNPQDVAVEASGALVVVDNGLDAVVRVNPSNGDCTIVSGTDPDTGTPIGTGPSFGNDPAGIAVEADGNLVVVENDLDVVMRIDPTNGARTIVSGTDPDTGTPIGTGPPFADPAGIAVEENGNLVVADENLSGVVRVNPSTGDRTIVSGTNPDTGDVIGTGHPIGSAADIAVEADGNLVVVDRDNNVVVRVDPVTGDRTIVSGDDPNSGITIGSGADGSFGEGIEVDANGDIVVVTAFTSTDRVLRVDPLTGDRTVISGQGSGVPCPPPGNDECDAAISLTDVDTTFTTVNATTSSDAVSETLCLGTGLGEFNHDVWFEYLATDTGPLLVSVCGANFDTDLAIYEGSCEELLDLACNGNACEQSDDALLGASRLQVDVVAGVNYKIRIGGFSVASNDKGSGTLTVLPLSPICELDNVGASDTDDFFFGSGVAIDGDVALIGAPNSNPAGAAYVFRRDGSSWLEEDILEQIGAATELSQFGQMESVAIAGDVAVVGANFQDHNGSEDSGSVSVFRFNGTTWDPETTLIPLDLAPGDRYGKSVAIFGEVIVVGSFVDEVDGVATGSAYVFRHNGVTWGFDQKLSPTDGEEFDGFGVSLDIFEDVIVIGANQGVSGAGAAYVYRLAGSTWVLEQKLVAADAQTADEFGVSVAVDGDHILVGARGDDHRGVNAGAAYTFQFNGTNWLEGPKLLAPTGSTLDKFGESVALDDGVAVVGAPGDSDLGVDAGSAMVFRFDGVAWNEVALLTSTADSPDFFGAVAVSGDFVLAGAPGLAPGGGSAHFFGIPADVPPTDLACARGSGLTDEIDVSWLNGSTYSQIEVLLDGAVVQTLSGDATATESTIPATADSHTVCLRATTICGVALEEVCCTIEFGIPFLRGDCNNGGTVDISDVIFLLGVLFGGEGLTPSCYSACDANDSGLVNITDVIFQLGVLFGDGGPTPLPSPGCGTDPTADLLSCASSSCPEE